MKKDNFYAVRKGRKPGVYRTWDQCKAQVTGYAGSEYKKFNSLEEANAFIAPQETLELGSGIGKDEIIAYVDGSYNQSSKVFGYGVILIDWDGKETVYNGCDDKADYAVHRNVAGEVYGSQKAIEEAIRLKKKKIYLHYDYKGIACWAKGEWKTNKLLTQRYKSYIDGVKDQIEIVFIKVKAHSNDKYNDVVDRLAKEACGIA